MSIDYVKLVRDKEADQSDLFQRMDDDKQLLYLEKYELKDLSGTKVPDIINITLNDPAVFAANVIASLGSASQQAVVESEDKKLDTTYIELFQQAVFDGANARLRTQGRPELNPFFDEQFCIRGRTGARILLRVEDGVVVPDIMPWDGRYLTYEVGSSGLSWAAYKTTRSKGLIEAEYGKVISGKTAEVLDIWTPDHNEVWIEKSQVLEQGHAYGFVPVVIQVVSSGSLLQDSDSLSHQGESIFFLIRDIIPELNRLASILQTLNFAAVKRALLWKTREGVGAEPPTHQDLTGFGRVTSAEIGGGAEPIPVEDIRRAALMLHSMMDTRMQRGSLSSIDLGTLSFPLSAIALMELSEGRNQVQLPRLQAKALMNQGLAEMFTAQVLQMEGSMRLGIKGHERTWDTQKLEGEYTTSYKYFTKSPKLDIARFSMAREAANYLDEDTIRREILQLQDPDGVKKKRFYDMAALVSPAVLKLRILKSLVAQNEDFEAELFAAELGMTVKQMLAGELPKPPELPGPGKPRESLLPLLEAGGGRTQRAQEVGIGQSFEAEGEE